MGADSNRDAFVAIDGAKQFQLPLVGPFSSIAPVVTAPWYWHQLIFTRLIFPIPYSPWIFMGFLSILLILIVFRIGVLLESEVLGLILAFVVALSPDQIVTAFQLNNPVIIGFFATVVLWIFLEITIKNRSSYWGLFYGIFFGLTLVTHYQALPLFPFLFFPLVFKRYKVFYLSLVGFFITLLPIIFFELNNHWFISRNVIDYLQFGQYRIWVSNRWLTFIADFWPRFWVFVTGGNPILGIFFMIMSPIVMIQKLINDPKKRTILICLGINFVIGVIFIRYYRGEKYFGYLKFFHPFVFLFSGYVLYTILRKYLFAGIVLLLLYIFMVIPSSVKTLQADSLTLEAAKIHKQIIDQWGDKEYAIYNCPNTDFNRFRGTGLQFVLQGNYNPDSKNRILYYYGSCSFPNYIENDRIINPEIAKDKEKVFPKIDIFYDVSIATEAAILEKGAEKFTTEGEYQRAARWWFDEQQ